MRITRLTGNSCWMVPEGFASMANQAMESKRVTNAYVQLAHPPITPKGAITTAGYVEITGSAMVAATICNTYMITNWGEPFRPGVAKGCCNCLPTIYSSRSLRLNGNGYGQGVLLVNGDFGIDGKFELLGLIIARDDVTKGKGAAQRWRCGATAARPPSAQP